MFSKSLLTATALLSTTTLAHQNLHQLWINDVTPGYQTGIRMPPSNSPVEDVTSANMACNVPSTTAGPVETVEAAEGDTIKVQWDQSGHPGPITHFLMKVDDASTATGVGAGWFKIDELDYVDGKWANEIMGASDMMHEFKLPMGLESGEYLLRSEMLALHGAQTLGGAQFYIGCVQLKITGTGSGNCGPTISIPGDYNAEDENIYIPDVYNGFDPTGYTAPGGPVASCGAGSAPAPTVPSTPSTPANETAPVESPSASPVAPVEEPSASASASPVEVETPVASPSASASPIPSSVPAPAPSTGAGESGALPATFTIETFIAWLEGKAAGSASKARRHARAFRV